MEGFNFAIVRHETGIVMISLDSLIGYFKKLGEEESMLLAPEHVAEMLERILVEVESKGEL